MPIRAVSQDQHPYTLQDILPTPKTSFSLNTLYPITLAVTPARAAPRNQSPDAPHNIPPTPETSSPSNVPTTPATALANA